MTFDTDAINNIKFTQGFRGYDTTEVDEFLDDMIREIEKLNNTIKNLKEDVAKEKRKNTLNQQEITRLTEMNENLSAAPAPSPIVQEKHAEPEKEEKPEPKVEVQPEPVKVKKPASIEDIKGTPEYDDFKQVLTDTLFSAQKHAEELIRDAQKRADQLVEDGERRAFERVATLNVEIKENQNKLSAIAAMVLDAKQRYKKDFQNQIIALDSIVVSGEVKKAEIEVEAPKPEPVPAPEVKQEAKPEPKPEVKPEPAPVPVQEAKPEVKPEVKPEPADPRLDDMAQKQEEAKQVEVKAEPIPAPTPAPEVKQEDKKPDEIAPGIPTFDFASVKKSIANTETPKVEPPAFIKPEPAPEPQPMAVPAPPVQAEVQEEAPAAPTAATFSPTDVEDDNQQYIELALSAYNDNKHHNTDYPNAQSSIKINEDDDQGGIYQPENRSVLSSVIEDILNSKRDDD